MTALTYQRAFIGMPTAEGWQGRNGESAAGIRSLPASVRVNSGETTDRHTHGTRPGWTPPWIFQENGDVGAITINGRDGRSVWRGKEERE